MRTIYLTTIYFLLNLIATSQTDSLRYRIYEFVNSTNLIETKVSTYLQEDASPVELLKKNDSLDFDYKHCMFISESYYLDTAFWKMNLNHEDIEYMITQIHELKHFKWKKESIKENINFITNKEVKEYSRKAVKFWNGNIEPNEFQFKMIHKYSAPIFNNKHNLALVYSSTYAGPLSASWGIEIYVLKDGKWIYIGHDLKGMS